MQLHNILIAPVITEKSSLAQGQHKYTFRVHEDASKVDIKNAVKQAYGVDAESVNIIKTLKKTRLYGRRKVMTKRPASKKAVITLKADQSIDFNKVKTSK